MKYVLAGFLILILGRVGILNPLRDAAESIFSPVQFGLNTTALNLKNVVYFFSDSNKVRQENVDLLNLIKVQEEELIRLKEIQNENSLLKEQLGIKNITGEKSGYVLASVMGNSNDLSGGTLLLDKGTRDGVRVNNTVVVGDNLVGIVRTVSYSRSTVELITSSDFSFTAYDLNSPDKAAGLAKGQHGSVMSLERILQNEKVNVGDVVVTSGKDGTFMPNLTVGKITDLQDDPSQPLKKATLQTVIDFSKMYQVFVVTNRDE